ncbi:MAG: cytochrome c maturation protein CcmE [Alphaproteobacteria bacterium]|nr:MAG: cytochrome c maturation protein CcmE [Alphaproteobacteria bacterium]
MAGLRKRRRVRLIVAGLVLLAAAAALVGYAMRDGIEFFRSPSQVVEAPPPPGERFRLGGLVEEGSVVRGQGETVSFRITDGANSIAVTHVGVLPDLFAEGQGVIVTGHLRAGVFEATEVLAKHDEKYMPREVADALKEQGVYRGD